MSQLQIEVTEDDMMDFAEPDAEMAAASETLEEKAKEQEGNATKEILTSPSQPKASITIFDVFDLPKDLDINKKWLGDIRLNVIHVVGVNEMSTEEVKEYFESSGFKTVGLEWINDMSCNVIFDDFSSSAKALTSMTSHLLVGDDEAAERLTNNSLVPFMKISDLTDIRVPADSKWVLGKPCAKSSRLLFRLANNSDKKIFGQGKYSEYYRKYGNPRFGGKKHIVSSTLAEKLKRMAEEGGGNIDLGEELPRKSVRERIQVKVDRDEDEEEGEEEEERPRRPLGLRMRMRADDEGRKSSSSQDKSIWDRLDRNSKPSIMDRLGKKSITISKNKKSSTLSVWSRLSLKPDAEESSSKESNKSSSSRAVLFSNIRKNQ